MSDYFIIGIAGQSGSGKSTVAKLISEHFEDKVNIIRFDDYYKDQSNIEFEERLKVNYDHPNAIDIDLLFEHIIELKNGKSILKPEYDFTLHTRSENSCEVTPKKIIVVEGLFPLLEEKIRSLLDLKIYVETDSDICFIRRLTRDTEERGRSQQSVVDQYLKTVKPMQEQFIIPTKKYADIVVLHGGKNPIVISLIIEKIKSILANENE